MYFVISVTLLIRIEALFLSLYFSLYFSFSQLLTVHGELYSSFAVFSFKAFTYLFEKAHAYNIYRSVSQLSCPFYVSIQQCWSSFLVQCFQVLLLCVDSFSQIIIRCFPWALKQETLLHFRGPLFCLFFCFTPWSILQAPSLSSLTWISYQPTPVIAAHNHSHSKQFGKDFVSWFWSLCAPNSETRSSLSSSKGAKWQCLCKGKMKKEQTLWAS